jgi:V8-like Glu-specific endopeptidase
MSVIVTLSLERVPQGVSFVSRQKTTLETAEPANPIDPILPRYDYPGVFTATSSSGHSLVEYQYSTGHIAYGDVAFSSSNHSVSETMPLNQVKYGIPYDSSNEKRSNISANNNLEVVDQSKKASFEPSAIGVIRGQNAIHQYEYGSCFIVGNGLIATAAHCVFSKGFYHTDLTVAFINDGASDFQHYYPVAFSYLPLPFKQDGAFPLNPPADDLSETASNNDWAILKLDTSNLQNSYGSFALLTGESLVINRSVVAGYPGTDNLARLHCSSGFGIVGSNECSYNLFQYVEEGMSGGPVIERGLFSNEGSVVGILSEKAIYWQNNVDGQSIIGYSVWATKINTQLISLVSYLG